MRVLKVAAVVVTMAATVVVGASSANAASDAGTKVAPHGWCC
jgi:hypothetical protein